MGFERNLSTVLPILFAADGGTEGQITLTTTLGLFVKQVCLLSDSGSNRLNVEIKRVLSNTEILVGSVGQNIHHRIDVSAFTVASGANLSAPEQPKAVLPMESRIQASYIQEPSNSWRTTPVDSYGNSFDSTNPLAVNIIPESQIPFTLGSLAMPTLVSSLIEGLTYDKVTSSTIGNEETLTFYAGDDALTLISLTKTSNGWILNVDGPLEDYLLLENGSFIDLETGTGTGAILLEA